MNDRIQLEAARKLGERMLREGGKTAAERITFVFQLATARKPDATERAALVALLEKWLAAHHAGPDAELAACAHIASLILNLDETITRN